MTVSIHGNLSKRSCCVTHFQLIDCDFRSDCPTLTPCLKYPRGLGPALVRNAVDVWVRHTAEEARSFLRCNSPLRPPNAIILFGASFSSVQHHQILLSGMFPILCNDHHFHGFMSASECLMLIGCTSAVQGYSSGKNASLHYCILLIVTSNIRCSHLLDILPRIRIVCLGEFMTPFDVVDIRVWPFKAGQLFLDI